MELFNRFNETIFLKTDSDLEKQLIDLKSIRNNILNKEEVDRDIRLLEYGIQGEKNIEYELKNANIGMYVIHDVTYEYNGNKAQIDYLIFTKGNYYIIECKNLLGNITVDNTGQFYREYIINNKKIKESIYSPFTQALRHQTILKKIWSSNHNKIDNLLFSKNLDENWFKPLVVLSNSKGILNTKYAPKEIKNNIIRVDQLIKYIENDLRKYDKSKYDNKKQTKKAAEVWLSRSVENTTNIADKYKQNESSILEIELKKFRLEKSKKMNIPPFYIFNDNELNEIIKYLPNNIEELKKINILSEIKIKYHGKEIIDIINKSTK